MTGLVTYMLEALAAAVIWGLVPLMIEFAVRRTDPIYVNAWRNVGAAAALIPICVSEGVLGMGARAAAFTLASAAVGPGIGLLAYTEALNREGPSRVVPISFTYVVWAQLLGGVLFGEPVGPLTLAGALLSVSGIWVLSSGGEAPRGSSAVGLALLTSASWALGAVLSREALFYAHPLTVAAWRAAALAAAFSGWYALRGSSLSRDPPAAGVSAASGVFGLGVGLVLYYTAMEVLGVGLSSLASSITPLVSQVAGRLVSGEPLSARILAGGALISLGLALVALQLT